MSTLVEDAIALAELRQAASRMKADHERVKSEADQAEIEFFERMEHEGVGSIRVDGVANFVRAETVYGQVQDRAEFIAWAEQEAPELLETKERKKLINEIVRERIDSGEELPPGIGFYTDQYVSLRAA